MRERHYIDQHRAMSLGSPPLTHPVSFPMHPACCCPDPIMLFLLWNFSPEMRRMLGKTQPPSSAPHRRACPTTSSTKAQQALYLPDARTAGSALLTFTVLLVLKQTHLLSASTPFWPTAWQDLLVFLTTPIPSRLHLVSGPSTLRMSASITGCSEL